MPNQFASGKYAIAECDRCAQRYKLSELRTQVVKTKPYKIKVCHECWDPDQPQLSLGLYPVNDPQAVREPRPDVSYLASGSSGLTLLERVLMDSVIQKAVVEYSNGAGIPLAEQEGLTQN
jgi:NAD-dependent SIR2 family protein deacetylase